MNKIIPEIGDIFILKSVHLEILDITHDGDTDGAWVKVWEEDVSPWVRWYELPLPIDAQRLTNDVMTLSEFRKQTSALPGDILLAFSSGQVLKVEYVKDLSNDSRKKTIGCSPNINEVLIFHTK